MSVLDRGDPCSIPSLATSSFYRVKRDPLGTGHMKALVVMKLQLAQISECGILNFVRR